jgi:N6-adenosine-specific RNA methylase IME4
MKTKDIAKLPLVDHADKDCGLFMWACDPLLPEAFELIKALGFEFKTVGFYWVKTNRKSPGYATGMGYWTRANPEPCLFATRGKPKRLDKGVKRLIVAPRREHSRKPDEQYHRIEALLEGPYLECFARQAWPGWSTFGNQVGKFGFVGSEEEQLALTYEQGTEI